MLGFVTVVEGIVEKLDTLLLATLGFVTVAEGIVEKLDLLLLETPGFVTVAEDRPVGIGTFEHKIWSVFDPPGHTVHTDTLGLAADGNGEVIGNESGERANGGYQFSRTLIVYEGIRVITRGVDTGNHAGLARTDLAGIVVYWVQVCDWDRKHDVLISVNNVGMLSTF
ncbi:hypothetical protein OIDMADRAFT_46680 [Oidiodendron maius Zn]|uniref:Uncharacterized protein n=1 Tax=Oidiodendron maius (strain Zn) TaxID=913774 RepID=A0A0C3D610_OIDMZ|nr:hypothetical protein OIDMADRAFT_46680 [Oidiodendron maius Zn]